MSYLGPGSELVLNRMLRGLTERKIQDIISSYEKYTNHYFFEPSIQSEVPVTESEILAALDHLTDTGILSNDESFSRYCVECFGVRVGLASRCPECNSTKVFYSKLLTHKCGFNDIEEAYGEVGKWVCPNCKEGIYSVYSECKVEGPVYKCLSCGSTFDVPKSCYICADCGTVYEMGEEPYVRIRKYKPTPILNALKNDIASSFRLLDALCNFFVKGKYEVKKSVLLDEDESTVYWDAVATKGRNRYSVLVLSPSERLDPITADRIIAKKRTASITAGIIITTQQVSEDVLKKLRSEKFSVVNPLLTKFAEESELKKTVMTVLAD